MKTKTSIVIKDWPVLPVKDPLDDFFEKLAKTPREWFLENGALRLRVRGVLQCPVSAVTGNSDDFCSPYEACDRMGMEGAHVIPWAADDNPNMYKNQKEIRVRLLEACGVEERHDS